MTKLAMSADKPRIRFDPPNAGWIELRIAGLTKGGGAIQCSFVDDPFEAMIEWLEAIVKGARAASWVIADEGATNVLTFVPENFLGDSDDYLLINRIGRKECLRLKWPRTELVREFYQAFRAMVESADYDPAEWEWAAHWKAYEYSLYADLVSEEDYEAIRAQWPFDGAVLRRLTSDVVEEFLAGDNEQRELPFGP